ncbi:hypothetical protein A2U01_0106196, partial [Trifolium medium]|nr:hypothetical protein [Trifolium medium]
MILPDQKSDRVRHCSVPTPVKRRGVMYLQLGIFSAFGLLGPIQNSIFKHFE